MCELHYCIYIELWYDIFEMLQNFSVQSSDLTLEILKLFLALDVFIIRYLVKIFFSRFLFVTTI